MRISEMRILIDTDILLDVLLNRDIHHADSAGILDWAEAHPGQAAVSWHGLANIHYLSRNGAEDFIEDILKFVELPPAGSTQMLEAIRMGFKDLEDAMQVSVAELFKAGMIVTRNVRDYRQSRIPAVVPQECLKRLAR